MKNFGAENNPMKRFNDDRSSVEAEGDNFTDFVIQALQKKNAYEIIEKIENGKINLELDKAKIIEAGVMAEKMAEKTNEEFDPTAHLLNRAEMLADELIKKQQSL